ncbi:MAG: RagB/SusD family nutrient uptake outer membrane protein [Chitinophagaceae bacterium]|nr:RagB/SusD family nutrient uptake outer membrane protein [Chitinophagaceae bacterium]
MKRIIKIIAVFILLLLFQSCNKDFLKPKPLSFYTPENVYVDKAGFEAGMVTVRKDLKNDFYGNMGHMVTEVSSSDLGNQDFAADWSQITPSTGAYLPILPLFGKIYGYIKNTNVIISRIDDIKWSTQADRNAILAEAYFYRSWWYYRLVHTYGDVPFLGKELTGAKLDFFSNSRWSILNKIQSDMEFAIQWLPEGEPKDKPSKYAGLQLLSKIYLVNLQFDKAIEAATTIINGPFALMKQRFGSYANNPHYDLLWDIHRPENKFLAQNTESIFILIDRVEAPVGAKTSGTGTMRSYDPSWWIGLVKDSKGLGATTPQLNGVNTPMYDTLGRGNPDVVPSPWAGYELWDDGTYGWYNTPDLRRSKSNWYDDDDYLYNVPTSVDFGKPFNPHYFSQLSDTLEALFPTAHYKIYYPEAPGFTGPPFGGNGDYYVYRLAETYLIRAEAYFWKGQLGLATDDINIVRERAHALPITAGDVTLDYIFDERARELYIEEMRHTELVRAAYIMARLNKGGYSLATFTSHNWFYDRVMSRNRHYQDGIIGNSVFKIQPFNVLWPIDVNVITANTKGIINQNEGYEGAQNNIPPLETTIE